MKLRQFNKEDALRQLRNKQQREYNVKNRTIVLSVGVLILSVIYFTYASFSNIHDFTIVNATVGDFSGDVKLVSYNYDDGSGTVTNHSVPPAKDSGYVIDTINCSNATGEWNKFKWALEISDISGKVTCNLSFKEGEYFHDFADIGDYVKMTPTSTSYTISPSLTGMNEFNLSNTYGTYDNQYNVKANGQTINPSTMQDWIVIDKKNDGTVELVSNYVLGDTNNTGIYIFGQTGYKKSVEILETIASQFVSNYTVSTRYFGYNNQTRIINGTLDSNSAGNTYTPSIGENTVGEEYYNGIGGDTLAVSDMKKIYAAKKARNPLITFENAQKTGTYSAPNSNISYYTASRRYSSSYLATYTGVGWYINTIAAPLITPLYAIYSNESSNADYNKLRIIVTIDSDVKVASGDGYSESSAYTLTR